MQVMIVDDERIIRDGLKSMIAWEELGFDKLTEARNALLALEQIDRDPPDLIITDIIMPEMTGIEFVKHVKQRHKDTHIIILTGYEKFEFAREAIQLGVAEYLVKPIYPSELYEIVHAAAQSIRQRRKELEWRKEVNQQLQQYQSREREAFWSDVVQGKFRLPKELDKRLAELEIEPLSPPLACVMIMLDRSEAVDRFGEKYLHLIQYAVRNIAEEVAGKRTCIFVTAEPPGLMVICRPDAMIGKLHRMMHGIDKTLGIACYMGIGHPVDNIFELVKSAEEAREAVDSIAISGERGIVHFNELDSQSEASYPYDEERQLMRHFVYGQPQLRMGVQAFVDAVLRQQMTAVERRMRYIQLLSAIYRRMDEWDVTEELPSFKEQFQSLMTADSEIEIVDLFERLLVLATDWRQKMQTGHTEQLAMHAKRIIEQQFADSELSVGRLAEELGITPNYLSRLFHRFTGKTVSEYMTATRIEAACELLRQTSLKVLDIAEQVGYTNGHYFSMVFKKHTGHSPGAYRDKGGSGS